MQTSIFMIIYVYVHVNQYHKFYEIELSYAIPFLKIYRQLFRKAAG